jgi:hypothetical protein
MTVCQDRLWIVTVRSMRSFALELDEKGSVRVKPLMTNRMDTQPVRAICSVDCGALGVRLFAGRLAGGVMTCLLSAEEEAKGVCGDWQTVSEEPVTALAVARGHLLTSKLLTTVTPFDAVSGRLGLKGQQTVSRGVDIVGAAVVGDLLVEAVPKGLHVYSLVVDF